MNEVQSRFDCQSYIKEWKFGNWPLFQLAIFSKSFERLFISVLVISVSTVISARRRFAGQISTKIQTFRSRVSLQFLVLPQVLKRFSHSRILVLSLSPWQNMNTMLESLENVFADDVISDFSSICTLMMKISDCAPI